MSTAFSGVGGPEHAIRCIMSYLGCPAVPSEHAIEHDQECRRELCQMKPRPKCLFYDINSFWAANT
eukprot:378334-Pyramimonas_sp.AAC.1